MWNERTNVEHQFLTEVFTMQTELTILAYAIVLTLLVGIVLFMRRIDQNMKSVMKKIDAVMTKLIDMGK